MAAGIRVVSSDSDVVTIHLYTSLSLYIKSEKTYQYICGLRPDNASHFDCLAEMLQLFRREIT